jgi:hypothetical protein
MSLFKTLKSLVKKGKKKKKKKLDSLIIENYDIRTGGVVE